MRQILDSVSSPTHCPPERLQDLCHEAQRRLNGIRHNQQHPWHPSINTSPNTSTNISAGHQQQTAPTNQTAPHAHLHPEIFIQIEGACHFQCQDTELCLTPGQSLIIPPGMSHREAAIPDEAGRWSNLVFLFGPERLQLHRALLNAAAQPYMAEIIHYQHPLAIRAWRWMQDYVEMQKDDGLQGIGDGTLTALKDTIWQSISLALDHLLKQPPVNAATPQRQKVGQSKAYIERHLGDHQLSVKRIAKELGCAADYLSHIFHQHTGQTLISYLTVQRLHMAGRLLRQSLAPDALSGGAEKRTIADIARQVGFADPGYFSRQFRKHYQVSPKQYRQREQAAN